MECIIDCKSRTGVIESHEHNADHIDENDTVPTAAEVETLYKAALKYVT